MSWEAASEGAVGTFWEDVELSPDEECESSLPFRSTCIGAPRAAARRSAAVRNNHASSRLCYSGSAQDLIRAFLKLMHIVFQTSSIIELHELSVTYLCDT